MVDIQPLDVTQLINREGWDCSTCGHRHAGRTLANICMGCACPETVPPDTGATYEGRATMREVTPEAFAEYRRRDPDGDWNISVPVGQEGAERYWIPRRGSGR
jgi:hypothetical protein